MSVRLAVPALSMTRRTIGPLCGLMMNSGRTDPGLVLSRTFKFFPLIPSPLMVVMLFGIFVVSAGSGIRRERKLMILMPYTCNG